MFLSCLGILFVLKMYFEKRGIFRKNIHFYMERSPEISGKGSLHSWNTLTEIARRGQTRSIGIHTILYVYKYLSFMARTCIGDIMYIIYLTCAACTCIIHV